MIIKNGIYVPTQQDLDYMDEHLGKYSITEMCDHLLVSRYVFEKIAAKYFPERFVKRKTITIDDERYIIENYPNMENKDILKHLDISRKSLMRIVYKFKLTKSDDFVAARELARAEKKMANATKRNTACSGTFCERKESCFHYHLYIKMGRPKYNLLNNGWTTKCINEGNFTYYVEDRTDIRTNTTENL